MLHKPDISRVSDTAKSQSGKVGSMASNGLIHLQPMHTQSLEIYRSLILIPILY